MKIQNVWNEKLVLLFFSAMGFLQGFAEVVEEETQTEVVKDHHIYLGFNLDVYFENDYYRMEKYVDRSAKIDLNGSPELVDFKEIKKYQFKNEVKVSPFEIEVENLKIDRSYSLGNDPKLRAMTTSNVLSVHQSESEDAALTKYVKMSIIQGLHEAQGGEGELLGGGNLEDAKTALDISINEFDSDMSHFGSIKRTEDNMYDAIQASFYVSSDTPIINPYIIITADFTNLGEEDRVAKWVHVHPLNSIDYKRRKVFFKVAGFRPGYEIVSSKVYLYANGEEIPTNLSESRVEVTEAQAHEYIRFQYLDDNIGNTLDPSPVWKNLPQYILDYISQEQVNLLVTFKVSDEGKVTQLSSEHQEIREFDNKVRKALFALVFNPALNEGEPVEGKVQLKLSELFY